MTTSTDEDVRSREIHRYVRLITPIPAAWLLLSVLVVWVTRQELLDSLSDYYGGPLRDVFVGALMACGVCMIAYKGASKPEDHALNFAGVNTFLVALVPNSFPDLLATTRAAETEGLPVVVSSADLLANLKIAVGVFLLLAAVFVVLDAWLMHWTQFRLADQTRLSLVLLAVSWLAQAALVVVVVAMLLGLEAVGSAPVFSVVHFAAAALLVLNLSIAAASHAFPARMRGGRWAAHFEPGPPAGLAFYRVVTVAMWLGIVVGGGCIWRDVPYAVLWTEVWEIVWFLVFWVGATRQDWGRSPRAVVRTEAPVTT